MFPSHDRGAGYDIYSPDRKYRKKMINENLKNIDPQKYYSAKSVVDMKVLPWINRSTFSKKIIKYENIFKPKREQKAIMPRIFIKGENIIKFIKLFEQNKL